MQRQSAAICERLISQIRSLKLAEEKSTRLSMLDDVTLNVDPVIGNVNQFGTKWIRLAVKLRSQCRPALKSVRFADRKASRHVRRLTYYCLSRSRMLFVLNCI